MTIKRTPDEIVARITAIEEARSDPYGVECSQLLEALPWEHASQFMREGQTEHTADSWPRKNQYRDADAAYARIRDYLPHAWQKANQSAGASAARSMAFLRGVLWAIGPEHDELVASLAEQQAPDRKIDGETVRDLRPAFDFYGKVGLVRVSELVGFDWKTADNDEWRQDVNDEPVTATEALGQ